MSGRAEDGGEASLDELASGDEDDEEDDDGEDSLTAAEHDGGEASTSAEYSRLFSRRNHRLLAVLVILNSEVAPSPAKVRVHICLIGKLKLG